MKKNKENQKKDNVVEFSSKKKAVTKNNTITPYDYDMFNKDLRPVLDAIMTFGDKRYRDGRLKGLLDEAFSASCKEIREIASRAKPRKD